MRTGFDHLIWRQREVTQLYWITLRARITEESNADILFLSYHIKIRLAFASPESVKFDGLCRESNGYSGMRRQPGLNGRMCLSESAYHLL